MDSSVNVESLSNEEIRAMLVKHGYPCGPVVQTTRKVYENKLKGILTGAKTPDRGSSNSKIPVQQSTPASASVGGSRGSAASSTATPAYSSSSGSSGGGGGGAGGRAAAKAAAAVNRSDYFADASDHYDDDLMEGEESFRYVGPVNDTPPSPYSALGGSMIVTPPAPPRPAPSTISSSIGHRLDYGLSGAGIGAGSTTNATSNKYSPPKPSSANYSFSTNRAPFSKTSTISYHTIGGGYSPEEEYQPQPQQPYRRSTAGLGRDSIVAPRLAAPTIPPTYNGANKAGFGGAGNAFTSMVNYEQAVEKAKKWAPTVAKIFGGFVFIIFLIMLLNRFAGDDMTGGNDDSSPELPA